MAYPGEGYKMSNYGIKTYSPYQVKQQWRQTVCRETKVKKSHTATVNAMKSPLDTSMEISYFNNGKVYLEIPSYDLTFRQKKGYNQKLKRDDLEHTQGLDVHSEEALKHVPVLSSSMYGHRPPIEPHSRDYVRVGVVQRDFYRPSGASINPSA